MADRMADLPVSVAAAKRATATAPRVIAGRRAAAALFRATRRLVRTHAFRLAGLYFLVFAVSVLGVLVFVYWTSADFVERQPRRRSTPRSPGSPSNTPSAA